MWYEILDKNNFIKSLYVQVPQLKNVRIVALKIEDDGKRISLEFTMPKFADKPPVKWVNSKHNAVYIKLDFFDIDELVMKLTRDNMHGDISIEKAEENAIKVTIVGTINVKLKTRYGMFQSIDGYIESANSCN